VPIAAGTKLGRYEIRSKIGEGGMGEVYRARDTEIGRDVAVKVLPSTFSADKDRLNRFQQEACAAGALNHPNILILHDIGAHNGSPYVVSELLEGETLRKRIAGTPLAQRRAIDYALQIANGLAAAHEKGIIHRDLKPDNIFITNDGRLKILDFGLAKLTQGDGNQQQTDIPTRRVDTDPGVVMGTVGYMSPEQLKGHAVDQRSDIFSFGAILYEMLSAQRAFHAASAAETMSAILKEDPPELSDTNKTVSPALERLVNHCLEKKPEARFHSARDLAFALEAISGSAVSGPTVTTTIASSPQERIRKQLPWILTAVSSLALLVALPFAILYFRRAPMAPEQELLRFMIALPEKALTIGPPSVSPDGHNLVYRLNTEDGKELLWVRPLNSLEARPLAGTEGGVNPFWSPDSRAIGFLAAGKLRRIDLSGGAPQTICDAPSNAASAWSREGVIIFSRGVADGLYRVPAAGGTPIRITEVDGSLNELEHSWPFFLPDGRHFLYLARNAQSENSAIYAGTIDSKETKRLLKVHSSVAYSPPGYLLFSRDATLMAQAFDANRLELKGEAFPVAEQVVRNPVNGRLMFSVSENGVLALRTGALALNQLIWFDRLGKKLSTLTPPGNYSAPSISPDEKRVALSRVDFQALSTADIWLIDLERGSQIRFTTDPAADSDPAWSPDATRIAFVSTRGGLTHLYQKSASGAGVEESLLASRESKFAPEWSPDGRFILYGQVNATTNVDLFFLPLSGERKPEPFLQTTFIEAQGRFSPDGRWVAYVSNETGQFEVYVQSFPPTGAKVAISTGGGSQPKWAADGRELYYYTPERKLMAVEVSQEGPTFKVGVPRPLFDIRVGGAGVDRGFPGSGYFAAARDGKRFLIAGVAEAVERQQIIVMLNWTAALKH
jgi:serine/threonine protein kinase